MLALIDAVPGRGDRVVLAPDDDPVTIVVGSLPLLRVEEAARRVTRDQLAQVVADLVSAHLVQRRHIDDPGATQRGQHVELVGGEERDVGVGQLGGHRMRVPEAPKRDDPPVRVELGQVALGHGERGRDVHQHAAQIRIGLQQRPGQAPVAAADLDDPRPLGRPIAEPLDDRQQLERGVAEILADPLPTMPDQYRPAQQRLAQPAKHACHVAPASELPHGRHERRMYPRLVAVLHAGREHGSGRMAQGVAQDRVELRVAEPVGRAPGEVVAAHGALELTEAAATELLEVPLGVLLPER
jgi:hypothetical protein